MEKIDEHFFEKFELFGVIQISNSSEKKLVGSFSEFFY